MRIVILTTTWQRPELTTAVLSWWQGLCTSFDGPPCCRWGKFGGVELRGVAVGDMVELSRFWQYSRFPNEPLGAKHNKGLWWAKHMNPDAVMVIGSDDICEPRLIENTVKALEAGALWTQPRELYYWHPATSRVSKAAGNSISGACRAYSARLLDMMNWKLWDDDAPYKLDGNSLKNIEALVKRTRRMFGDAEKGYYHMLGARDVEGAVLDIKTDNADGTSANLWPYKDAVGITRATEVDPSILERFEIKRFTYGREVTA